MCLTEASLGYIARPYLNTPLPEEHTVNIIVSNKGMKVFLLKLVTR
jgi:hypothetical protein